MERKKKSHTNNKPLSHAMTLHREVVCENETLTNIVTLCNILTSVH